MSEQRHDDDQIEESAKLKSISGLVTLRDAAKNRNDTDEVRRLDALIDEVSGAKPAVERAMRLDAPKVEPSAEDQAALRAAAAQVLVGRRLDSMDVRAIALEVASACGLALEDTSRSDAYACGWALEAARLQGRSDVATARQKMIAEQNDAWKNPIGITAADFDDKQEDKR